MRREDKTGLEVETLTHYLVMALDSLDLYGRVASYDPVKIEVEKQDAHVGDVLIMDDGSREYPDSLASKVDRIERLLVSYLQEDRLL